MKKPSTLTLVDPAAAELHKQFDDLLEKTNKNNPSERDVKAFKKLLADNPEAKLYNRIAGLMTQAEGFTFDTVSPLSRGLNVVLRYKQGEIRRELGCEEASEIEKLLISHVSLCWLRLALAEFNLTKETGQRHTLTIAMHYEKRLLMAQRRFTRACETLARVRRLGVVGVGAQGEATRASRTA